MSIEIGTTGRMVTAWGETKNLQAWVQDPRCHVSQPSLTDRLNKGWDPERAIGQISTRLLRSQQREIKVGDHIGLLRIDQMWTGKYYNSQVTIIRCTCKCGNVIERPLYCVQGQFKRYGMVSCGCWKNARAAESCRKRTTHGMTDHPLYRVYHGMIKRCYCRTEASYKDYGGRGITVCYEWREDFEVFFRWAMDHGWRKELTIERKDNEKGYSPDNCTFATRAEQNNNKRSNARLEVFGQTKTLSQWSQDHRCQVSYQVLYDRLHKLRWSAEEALLTPARPINRST